MQKMKEIHDFARINGVTIDMDFGYSFGVSIIMRIGNLSRSLLLTDAELSNAQVDFLTVLELMYEELKKEEK